MQERVRVYELDPTRGVSIRPRSNVYKGNDAALKRLVQAYDRIVNHNDDQIIRHLRAIQFAWPAIILISGMIKNHCIFLLFIHFLLLIS